MYPVPACIPYIELSWNNQAFYLYGRFIQYIFRLDDTDYLAVKVSIDWDGSVFIYQGEYEW